VILVDAADLAVARPGKPLFSGLSVTVSSGDRLAVVGINGCGKSTLLGVLGGTLEPESGTVRRGRGARVIALDQAADLLDGTVREAVGGGWEAEAILDRLGMAAVIDAPVRSLSGGQAKRVALARALAAVGNANEASESDLLILDEPTNHLDVDAIAWLEDRLAAFTGGLVLVTHDRHVLDRVTTRILELDRGSGHVHEGGYASYLAARAERAEREATAETKRRNLARQELAWLRRGAPARTRKPKAHLASARAIVDGRPSEQARAGDLSLHELVSMPRLGDTVVELHGVADGYGDRTLFEGVDLALSPGERLGVVGVNGSGKSTLLDLLAGRRQPRTGRVATGSTVRVGLYDQRGAELPLDTRVREAVAGPTRQPDWTDAALLERFWFGTDAQWAPIRLLSGGERRRLQLVLLLRQAPNVLLLDEPTNDLDLDTLRALEDMLETWPGALVVVSHDRAFLERTVEDVIVLDGAGHAGRIPGGYASYEQQRRAARQRGRTAATAGRDGSGGSRELDATAAGAGPGRPAGTSGRNGKGRDGSARGHAGGTARGEDRRRRGRDGSPAGRGGTSGNQVGAGDGDGRVRSPSTLRHLMKRAEAEMQRLRERQASLESELSAVADDHAALARVGEELSAVSSQLAEVEDMWLALAEEAESRRAARRSGG
jgi:ABC transport system ATP-binding/permease protein